MSQLSIAGFTNLGYRYHSLSFEPIDADLAGQVAVITGATSGLGLETARSLADLGAEVVIVGRNELKLQEARTSIEGEVRTKVADLSLLEEVRGLADELLQEEQRIDLLINNVGVLLPEKRLTAEGLETTFATNLAGHFLLTNRLLPRLIEATPARVISVSSGGMYSELLQPEDLQFDRRPYRGTVAYAGTKRAQVILTEMWAKRLPSSKVVFHAMHPGWARTPGVAQSLPAFNRIMQPFLRTPAEGADTIVWLAAEERSLASSGDFWFDRRIAPTHLSESTKETPQARAKLWAYLVEVTGTDVLAHAQ